MGVGRVMKYDVLIVGSGLYGAVFARECLDKGLKVLILEKRPHLGGNIYTEKIEGIDVHKYGAHIFHTNDKEIWDYVNKYAEFNSFVNAPIANFKGEIYNLPFNMNTFNKAWGVVTPKEAKDYLSKIQSNAKVSPQNLEEQAINLVGEEIYRKLIKEYTEKQWGRDCKDLPAFIIKRLPVRFTYDNNYFNDRYQGIPKNGYTSLINNLISGADIKLNVDFLNDKTSWENSSKMVVFTGAIDEYFDFKFGELEYRSLKFENEVLLNINDYQGNAVVNYTSHDKRYTRVIEHKHFNIDNLSDSTIITKEYPEEWVIWKERY